MEQSTAQADNQVRIFRDNPFAWYDKEVMRYLREKYGKDKKKFLLIRAVYTALTELESDFKTRPIGFFTKTVGSYAGVSREVAGKYLNLLEAEGLIKKTRERDVKTNKFIAGTTVRILSLKTIDKPLEEQEEIKSEQPHEEKPVSGYPSNGLPQRWDTPASIKNINTSKKLNINVNENLTISKKTESRGLAQVNDILKRYDIEKHSPPKKRSQKEKPEIILRRDYLAQEIADTLGDQKSLGAFRTIAERVPEPIIREYLANIKETSREGKVKKSRGALFVHMIQQYSETHSIELGFKNGATP